MPRSPQFTTSLVSALLLCLTTISPAAARQSRTPKVLLPLQIVPANSGAVLLAGSVQKLYKALSLSTLKRGFVGDIDKAFRKLVARIGFDPLDTRGLAGFGVDPAGAAGVVFLSLIPEVVGVVFTVRSASALEKGLRKAGAAPKQVRRQGSATILVYSSRERVIIRGRVALLIAGGYRSESLVDKLSQRVVTLPLQKSLLRLPAFTAEMRKLKGGSDLLAWLNFKRVVLDVEADSLQRIARYRTKLAQPNPPQWPKTAMARVKRELAAFKLLFGPLNGILVQGTFERSGASAKWTISSSTGSYLSKILVSPAPAVGLRHLSQPPILGGALRTNPGEVLKLALKLGQTLGGKDFEEARTWLKGALGKTVEELVGSMLEGTVEGYFDVDLGRSLSTYPMRAAYRVQLLVKLKSATTLKYVLMLASQIMLGRKLKTRNGSGFVAYKMKLEGERLELAVIRSYLVVSTVPAFLDRFAANKPTTSFVDILRNKQLKGLLSKGGSALGLINLGKATAWLAANLMTIDWHRRPPKSSTDPKVREIQEELKELKRKHRKDIARWVLSFQPLGGLVAGTLSPKGSDLSGSAVWAVPQTSLKLWGQTVLQSIRRITRISSRYYLRRSELWRRRSKLLRQP